MSKDLDLSKPLSDEDIADLKSRLPVWRVEQLVAQAKGSDFNGDDDSGDDDEPEARPDAKATRKK